MASISGLQMAFTDSSGVLHPLSFWVPGTVVMDNLDQTGGVTWNGFDTAQHFLAHDTPVQGAQHQTAIPTAEYGLVVSFPVQAGSYGSATETTLDYLAENVLDTPAPPNADGSPATNADGTPKLVSYFAAATIVTLGS